MQQITPQQYAETKSSENAPKLIDVREPWEFQTANIEHAQLMPLGQIYEWAQTLDKEQAYVIMCHHGGRSAMACQVLQQLGFKNVTNLEGGIDAWSVCVDPNIPRY